MHLDQGKQMLLILEYLGIQFPTLIDWSRKKTYMAISVEEKALFGTIQHHLW